MSTQNDIGVPVEAAHAYQTVRLLELPPDLLKKIKSEDTRLVIKSKHLNPEEEDRDNSTTAVLCTVDRSFQMRQVQSSNSIFVLQPTERTESDNNTEDAVPKLSAIAQCVSTLELVPAPPQVQGYLRENLHVYERSNGDKEAMIPRSIQATQNSRNTLLCHAPFSETEFNKTWSDLCCFEMDGFSFLPTSQARLEAWDSFLSAATIHDVNLGSPISIEAVKNTTEGCSHPYPLFAAIFERLSVSSGAIDFQNPTLSCKAAVPWTGQMVLESGPNEMPLNNFMQFWQDHLPESWRDQVSLKELEGFFDLPTKTTISSRRSGKNDSEAAPAAATGKSNRKWHEKFKSGRR